MLLLRQATRYQICMLCCQFVESSFPIGLHSRFLCFNPHIHPPFMLSKTILQLARLIVCLQPPTGFYPMVVQGALQPHCSSSVCRSNSFPHAPHRFTHPGALLPQPPCHVPLLRGAQPLHLPLEALHRAAEGGVALALRAGRNDPHILRHNNQARDAADVVLVPESSPTPWLTSARFCCRTKTKRAMVCVLYSYCSERLNCVVATPRVKGALAQTKAPTARAKA